MWGIFMLTALLAVGGYAALSSEQQLQVSQQSVTRVMAENMGLYRQAVVNYFALYPLDFSTVSVTVLTQLQLLPSWQATTLGADWTNARAADGTVYIFSARATPPPIVSDVLQLSQQSILVGVYRSGDTTLYSPVFGNTGITLAATITSRIPKGSVLWLSTPA
jgi:hypothetical protein